MFEALFCVLKIIKYLWLFASTAHDYYLLTPHCCFEHEISRPFPASANLDASTLKSGWLGMLKMRKEVLRFEICTFEGLGPGVAESLNFEVSHGDGWEGLGPRGAPCSEVIWGLDTTSHIGSRCEVASTSVSHTEAKVKVVKKLSSSG